MAFLPSLLRRLAFGVGLASAFVPAARAEEAAPPADLVAASGRRTDELMVRLKTLIEAGKRSDAEFARDVQELTELGARLEGNKSEGALRVRLSLALIHLTVLGQADQATAILKQIRKDAPRSPIIPQIDALLDQLRERAAAEKNRTAILGKPAPSLRFIWSNRPGLKSLSALKGKVVVLTFWTTGNKASVAAFPRIRELAAHYAHRDVIILGVTSLQARVDGLPGGGVDCTDNPQNEKRLLEIYARHKEMTWPVVLTEEPVFNIRFGVVNLPQLTIIAPDGTVRHNGLNPASPLAEQTALIDAILREFKRPTP